MEWDAGAIVTLISVGVAVLIALMGALWGIIRYLGNRVLEQFKEDNTATNQKIDDTKIQIEEKINGVDERLTEKTARHSQELEDLKRTTAHQVDESRVREMFLEQFTPFREENRAFQRETKNQLNQIQDVVKNLAVSVAVHDDRLYYPRPPAHQPMQPFYHPDQNMTTRMGQGVEPQRTHKPTGEAPRQTGGEALNRRRGDNQTDGTDYC